jgi:lipopolysaccharide export system protein LptC
VAHTASSPQGLSSSGESARTGSDNLWEPRRLVTLANVRKRSGFVGLMRLAFIAIAAIAVGVLLGHVVAHAVRVRFAEPPEKLSAASVRMLSPRFTGRDASGTPYVITAVAAIRRPDSPNLIDLERPKIDDTSGAVVIADKGVFDRDSGVLELTGNVAVREAEGNIFVSNTTSYNVDAKRVTGQSSVRGIGPMGEVRADSYEVGGDGDVLTLSGNVWTRLYPQRRSTIALGEGPAAGLDFRQLEQATQPAPEATRNLAPTPRGNSNNGGG